MTTPLTPEEEAKEKRRAYAAAYFQRFRGIRKKPPLSPLEREMQVLRIREKRLKRELAELQGKP